MKSFIPSISGGKYNLSAVALSGLLLLGLTASQASAKMPNIKRTSDTTISFMLTPPVVVPPPVEEPPVGEEPTVEEPAPATSTAAGTATIVLSEKHRTASGTFAIEVSGLVPGTYPVIATLEGSTPEAPLEVKLTDVLVTSATVPVVGQPVAADGTGSAQVALTGVNPRSIVSLDVISVDPTTAAETIVLTGLAESETSYLKFFANVRVTAPPASSVTQPTDPTADPVLPGNGKGKGKKPKKVKAPKVKKVHGHALAKSTIIDGTQKKHQFLFVAHGGPASQTLNVLVDGVQVSTVNSTKNGKVMFKSLPGVELEAIDLLTITDSTGLPVMQADFYP